ncbi:MAG: efflux RND transporter periplasmic adaptor subunit [Patescibacteria group bacterium]
MKKIKIFIVKHKLAIAIALIAIASISYWGYGKLTDTSGETRYITSTVSKGTIIVSVTGSGQVSASNQIDLKPKASGDIVYVGVTSGQKVKAGALIAQINSQDAQKTVRDAEANLQSAKISLEKLQQPADKLSLIQSENSLAQAKESKINAQNDLTKAYEDGFNTVANSFLNLPTIMTGLQDMLFTTTFGLGNGQANIDYYANAVENYDPKANDFKTDTRTKYVSARANYDKTFSNYKSTNRSSNIAAIESIISETYDTTKSIAEAVKSANNLIQFYKDKLSERNLTPSSVANTHLASLNAYTGQTNTALTNLSNAKDTLQNSKNAIVNADRSISEKTESFAKLKAGADALDIQSSQLAVTQRENALLDAKEKLSDYYIRAPFDGTIAKITVKVADSVSSGTSLGTFMTQQKIAEVSLNEVDVAKIKVGQKVTLTFDAVEGLSISGKVAEIDTIGTVSQGVVTYSVKISFDTQDERIKSGMSTSAAIITDSKQDVLTVPNSAIKSQNNQYTVEMFDTPIIQTQGNQGTISQIPPRQQLIEVGISDDILTEVILGLKENDQVVTRIISGVTTQTTTQAPSLLGNTGGNRPTR